MIGNKKYKHKGRDVRIGPKRVWSLKHNLGN